MKCPSKTHHCPRTGVQRLFNLLWQLSTFQTAASQTSAISSATHMLLEVVQRHMGSESLLQAADSTASAGGQTQSSWEPVMYRWSQGCACLAQCSVSLGNSRGRAQSHSHRLGAVGGWGEVTHCFVISCRSTWRQTSQFIPVESCEDSCSSSSSNSCQRMCLYWGSTQLQGAAEGLEALLLTVVVCLQLDYAHGCFQCPQKVEECRENSSDNCLFVFKKGKEGDSLSGEHQFIAKYPSLGLE